MFDGQSLVNYPLVANQPMPGKVMSGKKVPWLSVGLSGTSWTNLATTAPTRLHPLAKPYARSILVLIGGQSDIGAGSENNSGAVALADMEAYADAARAAGFDKIIACTIPPATMMFTGDDETERLVYNAGIRASTHWDAVADVAVHPDLDDHTNATYYSDGIHWTDAGATVAASVINPVLESLL